MTGLRVGHGYDVHRLAQGRPLILGGVTTVSYTHLDVYKRQAFLVTKSGDKVAKYFGISKYTLYSYIDANKDGDK